MATVHFVSTLAGLPINVVVEHENGHMDGIVATWADTGKEVDPEWGATVGWGYVLGQAHMLIEEDAS
jgi:hypothetical protein